MHKNKRYFHWNIFIAYGKLRNTIYKVEGEKLDEEAIKKKMQEINEMFDCSGKKVDNIQNILVICLV